MPNHGDKIKAWPMPGRRALQSPVPVDRVGGGRFLDKAGEIIEWSPFHEEQFNHGTLLLHPPPCEEHDHGDRGQDDCRNCGRDVKTAQQYDVDYDTGVKAAKADADARALGFADHAERVSQDKAAEEAAALEAAPSKDAPTPAAIAADAELAAAAAQAPPPSSPPPQQQTAAPALEQHPTAPAAEPADKP